MITIDGSQGEGGGQILRTAVALAAIAGVPVKIERIRSRRLKPGLQRQHLAAVQAAAQVSGGSLEGAALGSSEIAFVPGKPRAGDYAFDIGTAGSTTLVLQTVLPILLGAAGPSTAIVRGGTHNSMAPPVEFIQESFLPALRSVGVVATLELLRHGFHSAGGGAIRVAVQPWENRAPLRLLERGKAVSRSADVLTSSLPAHVAAREAEALKHGLHWSRQDIASRVVPAHGPGNAIIARLRFEEVAAVFTAFGEIRKPAEQVAEECARQVRHYLEAEAPVCDHLADQLLLPLALGAGGVFRTRRPSLHTLTNASIIAAFLGPVVKMTEDGDKNWTVTVRGQR